MWLQKAGIDNNMKHKYPFHW